MPNCVPGYKIYEDKNPHPQEVRSLVREKCQLKDHNVKQNVLRVTPLVTSLGTAFLSPKATFYVFYVPILDLTSESTLPRQMHKRRSLNTQELTEP